MEIIKTEMSRKADLYHKAIIELNLTTSGFSFREEDAETLSGFKKKGFTFETDNKPMSDSQLAEVETKYLEIKAEWTANEYSRNRQAEYPSIAELTVALYDTDDKSAVEAKRAAVKKKYPKP